MPPAEVEPPVAAEPVAAKPSTADSPEPVMIEAPPPQSSAAVEGATVTGIPVCDEYLDLYARCEQYLEPQIMAGNRRPYHAEEASLRFHATQPEAATLPDSCRDMLDALRIDCPEQHRQPPK